jgi:radical SAM protein with 4Fe4S-binding SPASM domain
MTLPLPEELYIEPTNRCNSRCETCVYVYRKPEPVRDMTLEELGSLVDQIPALRRVVLHGVGEPLLNRHLAAMVARLKGRREPPLVLFNSNAILLTPQWQEALLAAGLDEYRVSIDAARRELYAHIRGVDAFDQVTANVTAFADYIQQQGRGPRLSLWLTTVRDNLPELPDLVRLAHQMGVSEVYVQRLVYHGDGLAQEEQSVFRTMRAAEEKLLAEAETVAADRGILFRASGATTPRDSLQSDDGDQRPWSHCRRPSSLMYISANGNVLPCCFSPFTTHDYEGLILGNAFERPLSEIWNGQRYRRFRAALSSDTPWESCDRCGVLWSL